MQNLTERFQNIQAAETKKIDDAVIVISDGGMSVNIPARNLTLQVYNITPKEYTNAQGVVTPYLMAEVVDTANNNTVVGSMAIRDITKKDGTVTEQFKITPYSDGFKKFVGENKQLVGVKGDDPINVGMWIANIDD